MNCAFHSPIAVCFQPKMIPKTFIFGNSRFVISSGCWINLDQPAIELRLNVLSWLLIIYNKDTFLASHRWRTLFELTTNHFEQNEHSLTRRSLSASAVVGAHDSKAFLLNIKFLFRSRKYENKGRKTLSAFSCFLERKNSTRIIQHADKYIFSLLPESKVSVSNHQLSCSEFTSLFPSQYLLFL